MILGIDFGTCFSTVATMFGRTPVTDFMYDPNKTGTPSLFMYSQQSGEHYGYECLSGEAMKNKADVVRYIKKIVRENPENLDRAVRSGGKSFTVRDVVKKYLAYLLRQAKSDAVKCGEFENPEIEGVTVSAPVGISGGHMTATDYNKFLIDSLMEITGLSRDKINVVQEPVAAAISYFYSENLKKKYDKPQTILVFDLGGGTLDVTVVTHDPNKMSYEIKSKEGDLTLGGNDWDAVLGAVILQRFDNARFADAIEKSDFEAKVTKMKIDLSLSDESAISFKLGGATKMAAFTRKDFDAVTRGLLDRAIGVTKKAIKSFGNISGIDKIVLVGGSSNMPQIRERMVREFPALGEQGVVIHDPSRAIAKGAAIFNKMKPDEAKGAVVNDIVTHTYGLNAWKDGENEMIYNLLFKGTSFGGQREICVNSDMYFWPLDDDQTSITFLVYESDKMQNECIDGKWMPFGDANANGMEITVPIPDEFIGCARGYTVWFSLKLDIDGVLEIIVVDGFGNRVGYTKKQL